MVMKSKHDPQAPAAQHLPKLHEAIPSYHDNVFSAHHGNKRLSKAETINMTRSRGVQRFSFERLAWFRSTLVSASFLAAFREFFMLSDHQKIFFGMQVKSRKCSRQTAGNKGSRVIWLGLKKKCPQQVNSDIV